VVALTSEAIWIQQAWRLRQVSLRGLDLQWSQDSPELALIAGPEPSSDKLTLEFASAAEGEHWFKQARGLQQELPPGSPLDIRRPPEGVALVQNAPEVSHTVLGEVEFTGRSQWAADRGVQLRAGVRGADAVLELYRHRCPDAGWGACHVSGTAVRVEDADERKRLRLRWYAEEVCALVNRMLLLLAVQAVVLGVMASFGAAVSPLDPPSGETRSQALRTAALGLGLVCGWPLALLVLLRVLRWPQLLRAVGLAVLVATAGRGLTVWLAHLLAVLTTRTPLAEGKLWLLLDPVDWAFVIAGVRLCVRAWRLAADAGQILPPDIWAAPTARKVWSRGLLAATGVYAAVLLGLAGTYRYEASSYVLQSGVDPRRENEALQALNEGADQANRGELEAAERTTRRAVRLWEELASRRPAPPLSRVNLARAHYNLGWLLERLGRADEAERSLARAVALGDELAGDPSLDAEFKQTMASARLTLDQMRRGNLPNPPDDQARALEEKDRLLNEKDREAARKSEEAQVKAQKGDDGDAERLYREAIALWEEVLPQATNEDYRKGAFARLAAAHLILGELQGQAGKGAAAEESLRRAIDYGEKAVALDPDRPLPRHNLEVARQMLEGLRAQAAQEEFNRLYEAKRFADAAALCRKGIDEQEERVRSGKDRDAAARRLASLLNQFAWFLAHCPDERVRDTKGAVRQARRATELQPDAGRYGYTLALVQYRNGDWRDSLASLEKVKARAGELDAYGWFLSAMDLQQLKQGDEARAALRKGVQWIDETKRKAEGDPLVRVQYEAMRPDVEAMRREAEDLIDGKGPAGR
jgi:tetratricopeptide (TPR) repeat protein